jgi:hypothetical protein
LGNRRERLLSLDQIGASPATQIETNNCRSGFRTWVTQMVQDMGNTGHELSISVRDAMESN